MHDRQRSSGVEIDTWRIDHKGRSPPSLARRRCTRRGTIGSSRGGAAGSRATRTLSARRGCCEWSRCAPREVRGAPLGSRRAGGRRRCACGRYTVVRPDAQHAPTLDSRTFVKICAERSGARTYAALSAVQTGGSIVCCITLSKNQHATWTAVTDTWRRVIDQPRVKSWRRARPTATRIYPRNSYM